MKLSKRHIKLALIWFLFSLFCLQVSYVITTSASILAGWSLSRISLISIFLFKEKLLQNPLVAIGKTLTLSPSFPLLN
ncbi:hypothetical protein [Bacillus cereus]|uniref:Uncharacterized protein n=1 Tax=Bacillus cereus (strain ZK / E33L) TaxID=288681 RepID=Q4V281_BACCZ|nr:hypothetical protein [Bacillus cereus]AAY60176.1 uncharacterized protein pE33L466_0005 [Bacillus cereus E33L]AJI25977.1 hypothetical protein BF28_5791 [Bacillus cereus E33L]